MIQALFALAVIGLIVVTAETMWHIKLLRVEAGRKFTHILSAIWVASWPFFLSFKTVTLLSFVLLAGVVLTNKLKLGESIHTTDRLTSGALLFPVGIGLASLLTTSKWVFAAAMLEIGLADGLAGLIGRHYNLGPYKVFGHTKSILGTGVFLFTSIGIMTWLIALSPAGFHASVLPYVLAIIPAATTIAENISPRGIDNIAVPLLTIGLLHFF